jgi:hypothetical protein
MNDDVKMEPWKKGDAFSASHLNEMVAAIRSKSRVSVLKGVSRTTLAGTTIDNGLPDTYNQFGYGILSNGGPNGETDYTDNRYWVKLGLIVNANVWDDAANIVYDSMNATTGWISITNLAEAEQQTHVLFPLDETRPCVFWTEFDDAGNPRFVMYDSDPGNGQYQFMSLQMVAQNVRGWDMIRSHPATI